MLNIRKIKRLTRNPMYPPWTSTKCLCFDIITSWFFNISTIYSWRPCKSIPDSIFPIYSWFQSINIDQTLLSARCWSRNGNASTYKTKPLLPGTLHTPKLSPSQILSHTYFFSFVPLHISQNSIQYYFACVQTLCKLYFGNRQNTRFWNLPICLTFW